MEEKDIQADVLIEKGHRAQIIGTSYSKNVRTVEQCFDYGMSLHETFKSSGYGMSVDTMIACTGPEGNLEGNAIMRSSSRNLEILSPSQ